MNKPKQRKGLSDLLKITQLISGKDPKGLATLFAVSCRLFLKVLIQIF